MMRNFSNVEENPLLFASTYQAGDAFDMERTVGLEKISDKKRVLKVCDDTDCECLDDYVLHKPEKIKAFLKKEGKGLKVNIIKES